jgi:hypothetical protein
MKKFSTLLMFGCLMVMACVAFAAGDATQPLWGWNPILVSTILGIVAPVITSLLAKTNWSTSAKRWLVAGLAIVGTVAAGIITKSVTKADLTPETITATFATVFSVATITYQLFSSKFSSLTAANESKKN